MSTKREIYCHISNNSIDCNGLELFTIIDDFILSHFHLIVNRHLRIVPQ